MKKEAILFNVTGMKYGPMREQLLNFADNLGDTFIHPGAKLAIPKNWREAFKQLTT